MLRRSIRPLSVLIGAVQGFIRPVGDVTAWNVFGKAGGSGFSRFVSSHGVFARSTSPGRQMKWEQNALCYSIR
jgi:hypothetical protein